MFVLECAGKSGSQRGAGTHVKLSQELEVGNHRGCSRAVFAFQLDNGASRPDCLLGEEKTEDCRAEGTVRTFVLAC